jgi:hypothetical protein
MRCIFRLPGTQYLQSLENADCKHTEWYERTSWVWWVSHIYLNGLFDFSGLRQEVILLQELTWKYKPRIGTRANLSVNTILLNNE